MHSALVSKYFFSVYFAWWEELGSILNSKSKDSKTHSDLVVVGDEAMLAHINTMLKAEQVGHLPLRTLAETHGHLLY